MTTSTSPAAAEESPRLPLPEHHAAIEKACYELLARAYTADPRDLIFRFRDLDRVVLDHLEAEEVAILPDYSVYAPADARAIRHEHTLIRQLLTRIGLDVELHCVRAQTISHLIDVLRAHAAHEDGEMYPWAETHIAPSTRRALFARIGRSLRALSIVGDAP